MSRTDEPSKRKEIEEYFLKSKLKFIVLDPFQRRRRDSWKRLLEDNSILEDKNAFQEVVKRKMKVEKVKLSSFEEMLALHKSKKPRIALISFEEVNSFWSADNLDNKRAMLRIGIEDLKAHLDKINLGKAKEVLMEAIDFFSVERSWRFWLCWGCEE